VPTEALVRSAAGRALAPMAARTRCAVAGTDDLEPLLRIEGAPLYMGVSDGDPGDDAFADQEWVVSRSSGCLQLGLLPPLELVYQAQHNAAIGGVWRRHHDAFADFVARFGPRTVVEVGGAAGHLATRYAERYRLERWLVVEPNPTVEPDGPIEVLHGFVEDHVGAVGDCEAVAHSHVLEHLHDPRAFLRLMAERMTPGALMLLSVPDLAAVLALSGSNALNFEHTYYLGIPTLLWMLADAGFEVEELRRFERHSVFVAARAGGAAATSADPPPNVAASSVPVFRRFVEASRRDAADLARRARAHGRPVFLFGAHVFSQFLITCGFPEELVAGILDNDPAKQGRRLYGTRARVLAPAEIGDVAGAAVVVRVAHYAAEIRAQLAEVAARAEVW
jgi:hypothetical protein